jgi:aspartate/methionine/tyrosine aminotransferase
MKLILLFGLSKPFAIADMRIGIVIGKRAIIEQINGILATTSLFTPVLLQSSVLALFSCEHSRIIDYLAMNAQFYKTKRNILLACLMGFEKLQIEQSEIDETKLIIEQIIRPKKYDETMIKLFFSIGLSEYLTVCCIPAAGFFVIVNCQPFLQSIGRQYNMKTSLEVALFLSYFYRIRVIPEEMMGVDLQQTTSPQLLRLSYSINSENIVEAAFTIFSGLFKLKTSTTSPTKK